LFWSDVVAVGGARSPHSASTSRSVETTSPAWSARKASRARCCGRGSGTGWSPRTASTGPSMRSSSCV